MPTAAQLCPTLISYVRDPSPQKIASEGVCGPRCCHCKTNRGPNLLQDVPSLYLIYQNLAVTHVSSGQKRNLVLIALNTYFRSRVAGMVFQGVAKVTTMHHSQYRSFALVFGSPNLAATYSWRRGPECWSIITSGCEEQRCARCILRPAVCLQCVCWKWSTSGTIGSLTSTKTMMFQQRQGSSKLPKNLEAGGERSVARRTAVLQLGLDKPWHKWKVSLKLLLLHQLQERHMGDLRSWS